ncbi:MAG: septal ring lytic transglycosylase RlpA family protein [Holophagales bacterium]|nr:septal ring lytic transglycosylase RlpA family protein [Holophagales bacterium]
MSFFGAIPVSAGRWFEFQFRDIQIHLGPIIRPIFTGGFLRVVRRLAPGFALFVIAVFSIHCVKPIASLSAIMATKQAAAAKTAQAGAAEQDRLHYEKGLASWYGGKHGKIQDGFAYKRTASGRMMNPDALICAHRTLPFGTIVIVENLSNGASALLRVVDRGPFVNGRVVDVSLRAARELGMLGVGLAQVRVQIAKNILRTNYVGQHRKRPSAAIEDKAIFSAPEAFSRLDQAVVAPDAASLKALFASPLNPAIAAEYSLSQAPLNYFGTLFRNAGGPAARIKNLRLDPFINRKR